jgi:hypothetical protein
MGIVMLLFLFLFIFTIIGMQLFGGVLGLPETMADGSVHAGLVDVVALSVALSQSTTIHPLYTIY